jgi:hypothetical protein
MFGFISHAFHAVTHFVSHHWRQIVTIGAAVAVGVAVTIATGGLGAPLLLAAAAGGLAAGATGYTVGWLLSPHRPAWSWGGFAKATLVSGGLAVATAGLGEALSPVAGSVVSAVVPDAVSAAVPDAVSSAVSNAAAGSAFGAGTQVVLNAVDGRPLGDGVGLAAVVGGGTGAVVAPVAEAVTGSAAPASDTSGPTGPSETLGIAPALDGDAKPAGGELPTPPPGSAAPLAGGYTPGPYLSSGGFKDTYVTAEDPGKIIAIAKSNTPYPAQVANLDAEVAGLDKIAELGIPVVKVDHVGTIIGSDGQPHAAIVEDRYVASSRTTSFAGQEQYLNENTITDIEHIQETLASRHVAIADLQFLIAPDGHVVVNDPWSNPVVAPDSPFRIFIRNADGSYERDASGNYVVRTITAAEQDQNEINYVLTQARNAIAAREAGGLPPPHTAH